MSENVMLAHEYIPEKHSELIKNWWISEKYDGVCGYYKQKDGKMYSRNNNIYTLPDFINEQLINTGIDLHGEIWFGRNTFDLCSGMANRLDTSDDAWNNMIFMVFDTPDTRYINLKFEERVEIIKKSIGDKFPNIKPVEFTRYDSSKCSIEDILKKIEDLGGEGIVLRKPGSKYEFKRSNNVLKVKSWIFKEAIVTGYLEGTGRLSGMVGSLKVKNDEFGEFKVGSGLNDWQRKNIDNEKRKEIKLQKKDLLDDKYYKKLIEDTKQTGKIKHDALKNLNKYYISMPVIGDIITFRYKETTKFDKPKFPSFICVRDYE